MNGSRMSKEHRMCQQCGAAFIREAVGQPVKFCSHTCRRKYVKESNRLRWMPKTRLPRGCEHCHALFTPGPTSLINQRFCSDQCRNKHGYLNPRRQQRQCQHCGESFVPKAANRLKFCSRDCALKSKKDAGAAREVLNRLRRLVSSLRTCRVCNKAFCGISLVCSVECKRDHEKSAAREAYRSSRSAGCGTCRICGGEASVKHKNLSTLCDDCRIASKKMQRKKARWRRDAKKVASTKGQRATYESSRETLQLLRQKIARAKGKCRLCGLAMSKRCDPNSDRALEFDHRKPLCDGGSDRADNLQAICRRCNGLKAAFTAPELVIGDWVKHNDLHSHVAHGH